MTNFRIENTSIVFKNSDSAAEQPFLIDGQREISRGIAFRRIHETGKFLNDAGIRNGDRVAIFAPNSMEYCLIVFALLQMGAVIIPLSTRLPVLQIGKFLRQSGATQLITGADFILQFWETGVPAITIDNLAESRHPLSGNIPTELIFELSREATIIFTSGSGGQPKAALHNFESHFLSARGANLNIPFKFGDRWLLSLPLYHVGGFSILFRALLGGGAVVLAEAGQSLSEAIGQFQITHISLVATQLQRLVREEENLPHLQSLQAILLGGGPAPEHLIKDCLNKRLPLYTTYGSTEMASQVTTTPPGVSGKELFNAGRLLPYRELKISPANEILVKGPVLFKGYVDGDRFFQPFDKAGWFAAGDIGQIDSDGNLVVQGRKDHMFISGGENIHPEEIEKCLLKLKGVEAALVVPVPDDEFGHRPFAFIRTTGRKLNTEKLRRELRQMLPPFKIPDYFYSWPQEAVSTGIKPDRRHFQQLAESLSG